MRHRGARARAKPRSDSAAAWLLGHTARFLYAGLVPVGVGLARPGRAGAWSRLGGHHPVRRTGSRAAQSQFRTSGLRGRGAGEVGPRRRLARRSRWRPCRRPVRGPPGVLGPASAQGAEVALHGEVGGHALRGRLLRVRMSRRAIGTRWRTKTHGGDDGSSRPGSNTAHRSAPAPWHALWGGRKGCPPQAPRGVPGGRSRGEVASPRGVMRIRHQYSTVCEAVIWNVWWYGPGPRRYIALVTSRTRHGEHTKPKET